MNKKKVDIEAKMFMFILNLKEEKNKMYSAEECDKNIVYLFDNFDEFKSYFETNGLDYKDKDLIEICRMKTTKKGTVIALKRLCDYTIRKHNLTHLSVASSLTSKNQQFDVLAVPYNMAFVVSKEKVDAFKNIKQDPEVKQQIKEISEEFKVNNLSKEVPILQKKLKFNKK